MNRTMIAALAALMTLGTAACDDPTAQGQGRSEVRVTVLGGGSQPQNYAAPSGAVLSRASGSGQTEIEVRARVYVRAEAGRWMEVTRGAAEQTVRASGEDGERLLVAGQIKAGSYDRVRVEFERVQADVGTELRIGTGLLQGVVRVDLGGDGTTVVERPVMMGATARSASELRINLNAEQWLQRADAGSRTVAEADFRSAVTVEVK